MEKEWSTGDIVPWGEGDIVGSQTVVALQKGRIVDRT